MTNFLLGKTNYPPLRKPDSSASNCLGHPIARNCAYVADPGLETKAGGYTVRLNKGVQQVQRQRNRE